MIRGRDTYGGVVAAAAADGLPHGAVRGQGKGRGGSYVCSMRYIPDGSAGLLPVPFLMEQWVGGNRVGKWGT